MTNQNDARVAEAVGYVIVRDANYQHKLRCFPPEDKMLMHYSQNEIVLVKDIGAGDVFLINNEPPPFDSAPTADTDQIVLEWVQGQDSVLFFAWSRAYGKIVQKLNPKGTGFPRERFYKPGMYAQAVLAIQEERGE